MIPNIPTPVVNAYVCVTVIFGGLILLFGLLWCLLFIGGKAISNFQRTAHSGAIWLKLPLIESEQRARKMLTRKAERRAKNEVQKETRGD